MTLLSIDPATPDTGGLLYRGIKLTSEAKVTRLIIHRKIEISGFADGLKLLTFCRLMLGTNFKNQMACLVSFMRFKLLNPANTKLDLRILLVKQNGIIEAIVMEHVMNVRPR